MISGNIVPQTGTIDAPIGRSGGDRKKMAVTSTEKGRMAITKYRVINYFNNCTLVEVTLVTGRTHQIRVHFAAIGYPLIGDSVYGNNAMNKKFAHEFDLNRLFLHAGVLEFIPPNSKKPLTFRAEMPRDLLKVVKLLKQKERE